MPFTRGLLLIVSFSLLWGLFAGINLVFGRMMAGLSGGLLSSGVSLIIAFLEAIAVVAIIDLFNGRLKRGKDASVGTSILDIPEKEVPFDREPGDGLNRTGGAEKVSETD